MLSSMLSVFKHRELLWEITKRDIRERYIGQVFGMLWAVGHPLILMLVYVMVFGFIFVSKTDPSDSHLDYVAYILSGLIPWLTIQDSLGRGSAVITANANLVKQIVFPVELLPVKTVLSAFVPQIIATLFLIGYISIKFSLVSMMWLWIPAAWFLQLMFMAGLVYALSIIGAYFKDIKEFVQVFCTVNFFIMPMIYLPASSPTVLKNIFYFNPFSCIIWVYQDIFYYSKMTHPWAWACMAAGSVLVLFLGNRLFSRVKPMLGNVL